MGLRKYWLNINGANRMVTCDPEKDNLAVVLRRLGLTGVKIGCHAGQCGACSVILNGSVIRACVKKMKSVEDFSKITTIEGVGTPNNLHPLQVAWNTYGGIQCGFCTPGFIVSAKALLDENINPTRDEVRAWFQKHRNLCRCTGYVPLIDAVMAAAKVMRGECTIEDITYKLPADGNAYGTAFPRRESGIARVCGLANYGDDIKFQMPKDTLMLAPVLPDAKHAKILNIDYSEALKMPGVERVITAKDIKGSNRIAISLGHPRGLATGHDRPIICDKKIYKYGDIVAIVAADTEEHARAAAKVVKVDLEPLPEYDTQLEAILPDSIEIHEGVPNIYMKWPKHKGEDTRNVFPNLPHVVEGSFFSSREPHLPIEPDCGQAYMGEDDVLTIQYKSQFLYFQQGIIAEGVGYPVEKIRMIENETGGSFGYSVSPLLPALLAASTLALKKPVNMTLTYAEHQHMTGKRTPSHANVRIGADENGKLQAMEYHMCYDSGAYSKFQASLLTKTHVFMGFPYTIPNIMGMANAAYSNIGYGTTYRAFSSPQVFTSSEAVMDMMAEKLGMDPFEFRYKNVSRQGELNQTGVEYNEYPMAAMMDMLKPKYEDAVKRAKANSTDEIKHGVGISWGGYVVGDPIDSALIALELIEGDIFVANNTWEDVGQHAEAGALLHTYTALRPMNVPLEKIRVDINDTKYCPNTGISGGSRQHVRVGNATLDAARQLMDAMRKPDGTYRTYAEMVAEGIPTRYEGSTSTEQSGVHELDTNTALGKVFPIFMYNLFLAEVQVEVATGKTKVNKIVSVADVGKIGNKLGVEGQAYGGISHSIGFALKEDYSDVKKHDNLIGAGILECLEMPDDVELHWHESYRENGPHGSAGCSENFQSSGHAAVLNAINNAVGVRIYELPAKPEKIKAALDAKAQGKELKPDKYYLGGDFYEEIDYLDAHPVPADVNERHMGNK